MKKSVWVLVLLIGLVSVPGVLGYEKVSVHDMNGTVSCYDPFKKRNVPVLFATKDFRHCAVSYDHLKLNKWRLFDEALKYWTNERLTLAKALACRYKYQRFRGVCF